MPLLGSRRSRSLPPFRANYSAGSRSSVREASGETAAAPFRSYLPSSSSPSSISLSLGGDGTQGAGVGDYQRRLRQRLLVLTPLVLPAILPPFIPLGCRTLHQESMEVTTAQRTDSGQTDSEARRDFRRKAASHEAKLINSRAHHQI